MNAIRTTHNLDFEAAPSPYNILGTDIHMLFRIGTCHGQWGSTEETFYILSVINEQPGNGHLNDVFEWFEYSCKRDNINLLVIEIMNERFYDHLIAKRDFRPLDKQKKNCIKVFNEDLYKKLLRHL